jgi:hypothetical protein
MPEYDASKKLHMKEFTRLPSETTPTYADIRLLIMFVGEYSFGANSGM